MFILGYRNRAVVGLAANVLIKLLRIVPPSLLQSYSLDLVESLSSSVQQMEASLPCAVALNAILVNVRETKEKEVWKVLEEGRTVVSVVANLQSFSEGNVSVEWFQEMASLLSTVMLKWPQSRYLVWNDPDLMGLLESVSQKPDMDLRFAALKLYSSLGIYSYCYLLTWLQISQINSPYFVSVSALCGHGANELLDNGKAMLDMMISCMDESSPPNARIEGFKLAQRLAVIISRPVDLSQLLSWFLIQGH